MNKIVIITVAILLACCSMGIAQTPESVSLNTGKTVAETLKSLDGEWRMMYKVLDSGTIFYNKRYSFNMQTNAMGFSIDTMSIHSFNIDSRGTTEYAINWEENGAIVVNEWDVSGSWNLKESDDGIDLHINNAYYDGCPTIIRRVVNVNNRQLILQDLKTGDQYYYKRR